MPGAHNPRQNYLLAALPRLESDRLYPHLELVPLPLGEVLYESGDHLQHVYFPIALDRLSALCHGRRRVRRDRRGRQ